MHEITRKMLQEMYMKRKEKEMAQQSRNSNFSAFADFSGFSNNVNTSLHFIVNAKEKFYWIIDSGAMSHMCPTLSMFHKYRIQMENMKLYYFMVPIEELII